MRITHPFVSLKVDQPDSSKVRPGDWNAAHRVDIDFDIVTGASYAFTDTDRGRAKSFNTAIPGAATLPAAAVAVNAPFGAGWCAFFVNHGSAVWTIYPQDVTIDGAAFLAVKPGEGGLLVSHAGSYMTIRSGLGIVLAALAAVSPAADRFPYFTSSNTAAVAAVTALARTFMAAATQGDARSAIGAIGSAELQSAIDALVGSAPGVLDTISELADALDGNPEIIDDLIASIAAKVPLTRSVAAAGLATGGGDLAADRTITVPLASQAEAEAGSENAKAMSPLRVAQAIAALSPSAPVVASQAEAEAGTDNAKMMTALRVAQAIPALALVAADIGVAVQAYDAALHSNLPQREVSVNTTTLLSDANGHLFHPSSDTTPRTWTIDSHANVPHIVGTTITFINDNGAGVLTLAIAGGDTLRWSGSGATGSRTLAANGQATAIKVKNTEWRISGVGLS